MGVRSVAACLAALALSAAGATGCENDDGGGGGESSSETRTAPVLGQGLPPEVEHPAARAIDRLQRAFVEDDHGALCAGMTSAAARQAGEAGHGNPTTCKRDVRRLFAMIREGGGWRHAGKPRVIDVEADGSRAIATVALDRRWQAEVPLTRTAGRWRLSGFFGTSRPDARKRTSAVVETGFPPAGRDSVQVSESDGTPCPDIADEAYPRLAGGCTIALSTRVAPLTMLTALGDFKFDDCAIEYRVRVDSTGRTWTEDFDTLGSRTSVGCGDVNACYDFSREAPGAWRGRMYPDGRDSFVHRMDVCLQTCVGNFVGELTVRLIREDDGWRAEPVDGGGSSGLRFDSPLVVKGDFEIDGANG